MKPSVNWKKWAIIFLCYGGFGLFFFSQRYIVQLQFGRTSEWRITLVGWLVWSYCWYPLTPLILRLSRRFPLQHGRLARAACIHLLAGVIASFIITGFFIVARTFITAPLFPGNAPYFEPFRTLAPKEIHHGLLVYLLIVGIDQAIHYYFRYRERELQASQLATQLVQAQLSALRMQLQPHFLFNTLNSIAVLMHKDTAAAEGMLLQLSQLLRCTLASRAAHEIPLKQELEILERFLEIEQIRFHDRLTIKRYIEPQTLAALVPQLFFQPLVENAIRHGIADRMTGGVIEIHATRQDDLLRLEVRDNGSGVDDPPAELVEGVGLSNTRARLEHLYGADGSFSVNRLHAGGWIVAASLPFHAEN